MRLLEKQLKEIQSHCSHVFFETSESDKRTCVKCSFTERIFTDFLKSIPELAGGCIFLAKGTKLDIVCLYKALDQECR